MPAAANSVLEALGRVHILSPAQLDEVRTVLQPRLPDPAALLQELVRRGWLTAYQARQVSSGRGAELVLGNYLLLEPLGAGGSGQVFKARHQKMGRLVALKILAAKGGKDSERVERYREIEVVSQLSHPNIVHAYEAGPIGTALALVMEFVDGLDLERLVQQSGPLPVPRACDYIRQVAVGLQYAHERGLVHRDIKPSNLLIADCGLRIADSTPSAAASSQPSRANAASHSAMPASGQSAIRNPQSAIVKILDLGLARLQQPVAGNRTANLTVLAGNSTQGTPDYMSPEQALDFHKADSRSDIYSLGCTFYFLLTGQPPFPGRTLAEKLLKHQTAEPRPVEELRQDVPPGVIQTLRKMMAKDPAQRHASAGDIVAELNAVAPRAPLTRTMGETDSTLLDAPLARQPAQPPKQRISRKGLWILVALGCIVLLGLLSTLFSSGGKPGVDSAAVARTTGAAGSSERSAIDPGLVGHWRLDETSGTTAVDSSGKGNKGVLHPGADWAPGKIGGGVTLDGQQGFIDYGASPSFNFAANAPFTFSGWVNTHSDFGPIVSQRSSTADSPVIDIAVGFDGSAVAPGRLVALVREDAPQKGIFARITGGRVDDGQWHQFALVRSGNALSLYLDGTLQGTNTSGAAAGPITTNLRAFGTEPAWIKGNHGQPERRHLRGSIDDLRIYQRALSAPEIAALAKP